MRIFAFIQALVMLSSVNYSYIPKSAPLYAFDGVHYSVVFYLPETYFVAVEEVGEEFSRVTYLDMSGYVKTSDVSAVDYEPVSKYADSGKLTLKKGIASVYMYSDLACTNVLTSVTPSNEIFLYGKASEGTYYCKVYGDGTYRGYIGAGGVTVTLPDDNVVAPMPVAPVEEPEKEVSDSIPFPFEIILVVCLSLPSFLLVFVTTKREKKT